MSKGDIPRAMDYLGHIVEAIDRVHRYVEGVTGLLMGISRWTLNWCGKPFTAICQSFAVRSPR